MKSVFVTGSKGVIGSVAMQLTDCKVSGRDLPEVDFRKYDKLPKLFEGMDVVLHCAWNTMSENWKTPTVDVSNLLMAENVYRAAVEANVPRVVMASSVHADSFFTWSGPGLLTPKRVPVPQNPYGASKVFVESLGRHYATYKGLEVICVRFANVNPENKPPVNAFDRRRWLSQKDCSNLLNCVVNAASVPGKFSVFYGVSNHPKRVHDFSNPFGWTPMENADDYKV